MDIVERLRNRAADLNWSMPGSGALHSEAAEEIENLRKWRKEDEEQAQKGYKLAYDMITALQQRMMKKADAEAARLEAEYEQARRQLVGACNAIGDCGQQILLGQGIDPKTGLPLSPPFPG